MVITKTLSIKWIGNQREYYERKGYLFTGYGDEFECNFADIPRSSDRLIDCKCDYCNKIFKKSIKKYYKQREIIEKDCCVDCQGKKNSEVRLIKYGTKSPYLIGKGVNILKNRKDCDEKRIWEKIKKIFNERGYTLLSEKYISSTSPIYYICNNHIEEGVQRINWGHLHDGEGCKKCGEKRAHDKQRFSYDHVKNIIEEEFKDDKCKLISKIYNSYNDYNLQIRCECGEIFTTSLSLFIRSKRKCNNCNSSIGEKIINDYLKDNGYGFEREYEINPKEWKNPLYYDFYLPNIRTAIEYDGEQHFKPIDFKGEGVEVATNSFQMQIIRDKIKDDYSQRHDIYLIRIPYWERDNISKILDVELQSESQIDSLLLCSNE